MSSQSGVPSPRYSTFGQAKRLPYAQPDHADGLEEQDGSESPRTPTQSSPLLAQQLAYPKTRIVSLDVLRGATIFCMILANTSTSASFAWLRHSDWTGTPTPADMIFPTFLFIMGSAIPFSVRSGSAMRIVRRCIGLFTIGLALNAGFTLLYRGKITFEHLRIMGVLQRIAICYAIMAAIHLAAPRAARSILIPVVMLLIWTYITYVHYACGDPFDPPSCSAQTRIDKFLLGGSRLYRPLQYDPEGILSTVTTASVTTWLGYALGSKLHDYRHTIASLPAAARWYPLLARWLLASHILLFLAYVTRSLGIPFSKPLWTPPFVFISSSVSLGVFAGVVYWCDIKKRGFSLGIRNGAAKVYAKVRSRHPPPFIAPGQGEGVGLRALGCNPLAIYIGAEIMHAALIIKIGDKSSWDWIASALLRWWLQIFIHGDAIADLIMGVVYAFFWTLVAIGLRRIGWTWRL